MLHNLKLNLKNFTIELSQATIDAFLSHKSFCGAGPDYWLKMIRKEKLSKNILKRSVNLFKLI